MADAARIARELEERLTGATFGIINFWGLAVVRPNDESFKLVSVTAAGDRIEVAFKHESGAGSASVITIWGASGVEAAPHGVGVAVKDAQRLSLDDTTAERRGDSYVTRTPRGEGTWPIQGRPALVLSR